MSLSYVRLNLTLNVNKCIYICKYYHRLHSNILTHAFRIYDYISIIIIINSYSK